MSLEIARRIVVLAAVAITLAGLLTATVHFGLTPLAEGFGWGGATGSGPLA